MMVKQHDRDGSVDIVRIPDVTEAPETDYYQLLDTLREASPSAVIRSGAVLAKTFLRADHVKAILTDPKHFSSAPIDHGKAGYLEDLLIPITMDPPEHTRYRLLLQPMFTPAIARGLAARMRELARQLIVEATSGSQCDFIEQFAKPYAGLIFCELVGLPVADLPDILRWEQDVWLPPADDPDESRQAAGLAAIKAYLDRKIAEVRANPDGSMLARLAAAEVEGRPLTDHEIKMIGLLTCLGGIHTTKAALGKMMLFLGLRPDVQQDLRENFGNIPTFIEEFLRLYSLGQSYRHVRVDTEVGGCPLHRGEMIAVQWGSANRDPRVYDRPDELDFGRKAIGKHLAFGYGPHMCLGVHVARLDMAIALEEWLTTLPAFRIAGDRPPEEQTLSGVGLKSLPLRW
jgi:cytochrome P450